MIFYIRNEGYTLASALREALEELFPEDFVACTVKHPLDEHCEVHAPSVQCVRQALLHLKDKVCTAKVALK